MRSCLLKILNTIRKHMVEANNGRLANTNTNTTTTSCTTYDSADMDFDMNLMTPPLPFPPPMTLSSQRCDGVDWRAEETNDRIKEADFDYCTEVRDVYPFGFPVRLFVLFDESKQHILQGQNLTGQFSLCLQFSSGRVMEYDQFMIANFTSFTSGNKIIDVQLQVNVSDLIAKIVKEQNVCGKA